MSGETFVWTPELTQKFFHLRLQNEWLFKKKKQAWRDFHELLLTKGFPKSLSINHMRKKWQYTFDCYKIAKRTNNTSWIYYDIFDRYVNLASCMEKYSTWNSEWRCKLIDACRIHQIKEGSQEPAWIAIEMELRCKGLPIDCCIQDLRGLWHHLKMTFRRKYRMCIKKGSECTDFEQYDAMKAYYEECEPEMFLKILEGDTKSKSNKSTENTEREEGFVWNRDTFEAFIQIRLQNDWLFKQKGWVWKDMKNLMVEEYGFPATLSYRELRKKWSYLSGAFQKAKARQDKKWLYWDLFQKYLESDTCVLDPLKNWKEEWVLRLILSRTKHEELFSDLDNDELAWREVEKDLRSNGLPLDHSLWNLSSHWNYLLKTFKWKHKFANKGELAEPWPYYKVMEQYNEMKQSIENSVSNDNSNMSFDNIVDLRTNNKITIEVDPGTDHGYELVQTDSFHDNKRQEKDSDDMFGEQNSERLTYDQSDEDDIKLIDLKNKINDETTKFHNGPCRACFHSGATHELFNSCKQDIPLVEKLKIIGGVEVKECDTLPHQICDSCLNQLNEAFEFRKKCEAADRKFRSNTEISVKLEKPADIFDNDNMSIDYHNNYDECKLEICLKTEVADNHNLSLYEIRKQSMQLPRTRKRKIKIPKKITSKPKPKNTVASKPKKYTVKRVMCEICGTAVSNMSEHVKKHSESKDYECDICHKPFKYKSAITIHKQTKHNSVPVKKCPICDKEFFQITQYKKHIVYHNNVRKYVCDTCGKAFHTSDILRVHYRMHTNERPYSCSECGKTFRTSGCVSRHKRIVHFKKERT